MKTFLGIITGLLSGTILGALLMAFGIVADDDLREFANKQAEKVKEL